jgi:hypothetical protein
MPGFTHAVLPLPGRNLLAISDVYVTADGIVYAADRSGGGLYVPQFEGA